MHDIKKHIGIIKNTGTRVVVVFRHMPEDRKHCLVAEIDRLPEMYSEKMKEYLNSQAAKQTNDFYEYLNTRIFPDGNNALNALHINGLLRKIEVDMVQMTPLPHQELPLQVLNDQIDGVEENKSEKSFEEPTMQTGLSKDPHLLEGEERLEYAKNLMAQSKILKEDAAQKENLAIELCPELAKKKRGRPRKSESQAVATQKERNAYKKENKTQNKEKALEAEIDKKVEEKIKRDQERLES